MLCTCPAQTHREDGAEVMQLVNFVDVELCREAGATITSRVVRVQAL